MDQKSSNLMKMKINREVTTNIFASLIILFIIASCEGPKSNHKDAETNTRSNETRFKTGNAEKGKVVYDKYCYYCHGREGRGDGAIGIAVTPHPVDFVRDKKKMAKSDEELFKSISEGIRREVGSDEMAMPRWKDILTEDEIWDALAYVRELSKDKK